MNKTKGWIFSQKKRKLNLMVQYKNKKNNTKKGEKMIKSIKKSMRNINWRLFWALMVMSLCQTVYTTVRTFFLG